MERVGGTDGLGICYKKDNVVWLKNYTIIEVRGQITYCNSGNWWGTMPPHQFMRIIFNGREHQTERTYLLIEKETQSK